MAKPQMAREISGGVPATSPFPMSNWWRLVLSGRLGTDSRHRVSVISFLSHARGFRWSILMIALSGARPGLAARCGLRSRTGVFHADTDVALRHIPDSRRSFAAHVQRRAGINCGGLVRISRCCSAGRSRALRSEVWRWRIWRRRFYGWRRNLAALNCRELVFRGICWATRGRTAWRSRSFQQLAECGC